MPLGRVATPFLAREEEMARYVIPITLELHFEVDTLEQAKEKFYLWRKFVSAALRGHLAEIGVFRVFIPSVRDIMEVNDEWLENRKLRSKFRREWDYEVREIPLAPNSRYGQHLKLTHRIAIGPKVEREPTVLEPSKHPA